MCTQGYSQCKGELTLSAPLGKLPAQGSTYVCEGSEMNPEQPPVSVALAAVGVTSDRESGLISSPWQQQPRVRAGT